MNSYGTEVIVAGHICLDIIPNIYEKNEELLIPGKLVEVGQAVHSTGGVVANTGLALHRLGFRVKLMGKIGDDLFGHAILAHLQSQGDLSLGEGMIVIQAEHTSYSIVINPPRTDRTFLHFPGANDTFSSADIQETQLQGARLFHFGYPPLMRKMYEDDGKELVLLIKRVKEQGLTVSLDMARPDPESLAGKADWSSILRRVLPYVDVFLPCFEETLFMLRRNQYDQFLKNSHHGTRPYFTETLLEELTEELLDMGAAIAGLKLGEYGFFVRTTASIERLSQMGPCAPARRMLNNWTDRKLYSTCYEVAVKGSTGAGDCTIGGFLAGLLRGLSLEQTLNMAVAAGACSVEQADATSGIPIWDCLDQRISNGWKKKPLELHLHGWMLESEGNWVEAN